MCFLHPTQAQRVPPQHNAPCKSLLPTGRPLTAPLNRNSSSRLSLQTAWSRLTVEVRALKGRPRGASPHIPSFRTLAGPSSTPLSQMLRTRPRFGPTRRVHASPLAQLWGLPEDCTAIFRHRVAHRTDNTISTLFFLVDSSFPLLQDTLKIPEVRLQD
eukprot:GGOE01012190.1.p4 GENE.GGOE01012190.1~~GGOE01012190.1.p4  ORF type:complete len:158 (-),score=7.34 GGOE01012190.1:189-662(-)